MFLSLYYVSRSDSFLALPPHFLQQHQHLLTQPLTMLRLSGEHTTLYLGYNGLSSESDSLEIGGLVARHNGLADGEVVKVEVVSDAGQLALVRMFCKEEEYALLANQRFRVESEFLNCTQVLGDGMVVPIACGG